MQTSDQTHERRGYRLEGGAPAPLAPTEKAKDHLDMRRILKGLVRESRLIWASVAVGLLGFLVYWAVTPTQYTATAQVLVDLQKPTLIRGEVVPGLDTGRFIIGPVIDSQVEILASSPLAARVIRGLNLEADPHFAPSFVSRVRRAVTGLFTWDRPEKGALAADGPGAPPEMIEKFRSMLDVRRKGLTLIINVAFTHASSERAALIANRIVADYIEAQREAKIEATRQATGRLRERVEELRSEVETAELRVQEFREAHHLASVGGASVVDRQIAEALAQLAAAKADAAGKLTERKELERLLLNPGGATTNSRVLKSEPIIELRRQQAQLISKRDTLVNQLGPQNQQVERTDVELRDLRSELDKEIGRLVRNARSESDAAESRVKSLEARLVEMRNALATRNRTARITELERQAKVSSDLYLSMLARLEETQAQESLVYADARVVARAYAPPEPSAPRKALGLVLALMGGFGVGITLALLKDHTSRILRTVEEITGATGLPCIAAVPTLAADDAEILREVVLHRSSPFSQAIFSLKHWLAGKNDAGRSKVIGVLSAVPQEGKTTIAANLAHYAALSGKKTLLIDCDLRDPKLTAHLSPRPARSLLDVLDGRAVAGDVIARIEESGVFFCPGPDGVTPLLPMEILSSRALSDFLVAARQDYDLIVLDTSPLLATVDARALLDAIDIGVLVVECDRTTSDQALRALGAAPAVAAKTAGIVLNKVADATSTSLAKWQARSDALRDQVSQGAAGAAKRLGEWKRIRSRQ